MKNFDSTDNLIKITDPVDNYFECIACCDITDGVCISMCIEKLRESDN